MRTQRQGAAGHEAFMLKFSSALVIYFKASRHKGQCCMATRCPFPAGWFQSI